MINGITRYSVNGNGPPLAEVVGWVPHMIGELITLQGITYKVDRVTSHMIDTSFVVREFVLVVY